MRYERHIHHSKLVIDDPDFSKMLDAVRDKADERFNGYVKVVVHASQIQNYRREEPESPSERAHTIHLPRDRKRFRRCQEVCKADGSVDGIPDADERRRPQSLTCGDRP